MTFIADAQGVTVDARPRPWASVRREVLGFPHRPIIGVMGRKRAGKDTFAARLVEAHGFKRHAFADALKEAALELDPIVTPVDTVASSVRLSETVRLVGWEGAKGIAEVRRTLQQYGQAIRRIDPDFWLRHVLKQIADDAPHPAVITDVRYPNEAEAIRRMGGSLVRVVRPGQDDGDTHESETALDAYNEDWFVANTTTVECLHRQADAIARHLRE